MGDLERHDQTRSLRRSESPCADFVRVHFFEAAPKNFASLIRIGLSK